MFPQVQITNGTKYIILIFIGFLGSFFISEAHADPILVSQQVQEMKALAKTCLKANDYTAARANYQAIIQSFPDTEHAMHAQAEIARSFAEEGDDLSAKAAQNVLYSKYVAQPDLFKAIDRTLRIYRKQKEYDKAIACYAEGLTKFPEHAKRIRFKQWIIEGHLLKRDIIEADGLLDEFWADNSTDPLFPNAVRHIGWFYRQADQSDKAIQIYKQALSEFPGHKEGIQLQKALVGTYIAQGDAAKAEQELEVFWSTYQDQDDFVKCVRSIKSQYWTKGKPQKSRALCRRLLAEFPKHKSAHLLRKDLVNGYLKTGELAEAETVVEEMFVKDPNSPQIVQAGRSVAYAFRRKNDSGKALDIYSRLLLRHPDHEKAIHIQSAIAKCYMELGAFDQVDVPLGVLLEKYPSHPSYGSVISNLAWGFRDHQKYTRAIELCQNVLDQNPSIAVQADVYAEIAKATVYLEENVRDPNSPVPASPDIDEFVQLIMTDYADTKKLGYHIFQIAEQYYFRAEAAEKKGQAEQSLSNYQRALTIWQKNINQISDSHHKCLASYYSAMVYQKIGKYDDAITNYQHVLDNWPGHEKAGISQYRMANCYNWLYKKGEISKEDRNKIVRDCLTLLLENYPDCSVAKLAEKELQQILKQI